MMRLQSFLLAHAEKRVNLTLQLSLDEAKSWQLLHLLHPGPSAYSDLAFLGNDAVGCLYERGSESPYETITLARFALPGASGETLALP